MLQKFRERMQGIIAWSIVIAICITFALWGVQNYLRGGSKHDIVAKIDGTKITQKQVEQIYNNLRREKTFLLGADFLVDQKAQSELKKEAIQQLIKNTVMLKYVDKAGFYAGLPQVRATIYSLPAFQFNGSFSPQRYKQTLSNLGYSESMLIDEMRKTISLSQLDAGILQSSFALPNEINKAIELRDQKRDIEYFIIDPKRFANEVKINISDVKNYYEKNKDKFIAPEKVSINYIQLDAEKLKSKISIDPNKLQQFYKEHISLYSLPKQNNPAFSEVKNKVTKDFIQQESMHLFAEQNDKLADLVYTNSDSLKPAADTLGLTIQESDLFTKTGGKTGLIANPKVIKAAFSDVVLRQGYNSAPIEINPGNVIVLRIKKNISEEYIPLSTIQSSIENLLKQKQSDDKGADLSEKIIRNIEEKKPIPSIANQYNLKLFTVQKIGRNDKKIDSDIIKTAFNTPAPVDAKISANSIKLTNGNFAIVMVSKIYAGTPNLINFTARQKLKKQLENQYGDFERDLLLSSIMNKTKVKILEENVTLGGE